MKTKHPGALRLKYAFRRAFSGANILLSIYIKSIKDVFSRGMMLRKKMACPSRLRWHSKGHAIRAMCLNH